MPEDSSAELRGYYCLESDWSSEQEAQVQRGQDAEIIAVDPELSEKSSTSGPGQVDTLGAEYGTDDANEDGKLDGLSLYTFQDEDPGGTWRAILTANDNAGIRSPQWRTHDALRMLTANDGDHPRQASNYDETDWVFKPLYWVFNTAPSATKAAATQNGAWWIARAYNNKPAEFAHERLLDDRVFWFAGHGMNDHFNFDPDGGADNGVLTYSPCQFPAATYYIPANMSHVWFFGGTGCTTACSPPNLISKAADAGAHGVLGWSSSPESAFCGRYSELLWHFCMEDFQYYDEEEEEWWPTWPAAHAEAATAACAVLKAEEGGSDRGFGGIQCYGTNKLLQEWCPPYFEVTEPRWPTSVSKPSNVP